MAKTWPSGPPTGPGVDSSKPDLPRLDYISCKKKEKKNIAIVALNGLSINDITVGVIRNQLFIEYWPSNR